MERGVNEVGVKESLRKETDLGRERTVEEEARRRKEARIVSFSFTRSQRRGA